MNALSLVVFYALLGVAVFVWRGDLTAGSRETDAVLAFGVVVLGIALLVLGWKRQKPTVPAKGGSPRAWWLAALAGGFLVALLGWLFLKPLPQLARMIARPQPPPGESAGADTGSAPTPEVTPQKLPSTPLPEPSDSTGAGQVTSESPPAAAEPPFDWKKWLLWLAAAVAGLLAAWLFWPRKRQGGSGAGPRTSWWEDPDAPDYVRELRRLCAQCEVFPERGDTLRALVSRLAATGRAVSALEPVAEYHYAVWFAGAPREASAEKRCREVVRTLRRAERAATGRPPAETAPAA